MFAQIKVCLLCFCVLPFVTGCAILGDPAEKAASAGGKLVKYYCANVTVPEVREKIRERVNYHAAPDAIAVTCADGNAPATPALNTGVDQEKLPAKPPQ
jgi:hypothetical protein